MAGLLDWLEQHNALLSLLVNVLMLGVWLFYAQLFFTDYRRRHRPRLMIQLAPWVAREAQCLLVNMSQQTLDVVGILLVAVDGGWPTLHITDYQQVQSDEAERSVPDLSILKQGPLSSGGYIALGRFDDLLRRLDPPIEDDPREHYHGDVGVLEIRVIAYVGDSDRPIGARRRFTVTTGESGSATIRPETLTTDQLDGWWSRRTVSRWLRRENPRT